MKINNFPYSPRKKKRIKNQNFNQTKNKIYNHYKQYLNLKSIPSNPVIVIITTKQLT